MERIAIGQIRSPHGVRGHLKARSYSGETAHFLKLKSIYLASGGRERCFEVTEARRFGEDVLLKLAGIETPEEGKRYSSWEIYAQREDASSLQAGEFYFADLCRCAVTKDGRKLGRITAVVEGGASELLEVETEEGGRRLVPFLDRFVGAVDIAKGTVELKEEWLLK